MTSSLISLGTAVITLDATLQLTVDTTDRCHSSDYVVVASSKTAGQKTLFQSDKKLECVEYIQRAFAVIRDPNDAVAERELNRFVHCHAQRVDEAQAAKAAKATSVRMDAREFFSKIIGVDDSKTRPETPAAAETPKAATSE